jgi:hypothetical protein
MKNLKSFLAATALITLTQTTAFAIEVEEARLDGSGKNILVDVVHGGGCGQHEYSLEIQGCLESMPVQCTAKLIHKTDDMCEAMLYRTATINLADSGLNEQYFSNASLVITGSRSKVQVTLPDFKPALVENKTICTTHTGSQLEITNNSVNLTTIAGVKAVYAVEKIDSLSLESYPPIEKKTYSLDDGRSIVTMFTGEETTGTGRFIRLTGEYSPEFTCQK